MSVSSIYSLAPPASLTTAGSSSDGGPSVLMITLLVLGGIFVFSFLSPGATVVVVEKPAGSLPGFALIALALGILYFGFIAPGSFPI